MLVAEKLNSTGKINKIAYDDFEKFRSTNGLLLKDIEDMKKSRSWSSKRFAISKAIDNINQDQFFE